MDFEIDRQKSQLVTLDLYQQKDFNPQPNRKRKKACFFYRKKLSHHQFLLLRYVV